MQPGLQTSRHARLGNIQTPVLRRMLPALTNAPGLIEIDLGNGRQVRVGRDVNLAALRRVLAALRE